MTVTIGERGRVVFGDAVERLRELPDGSVDCVVTSPPYWQLRDYGHEGQLGLEASPRAFVERLASVFDEVWRVLSPKGTCWVNLGDTYLAGKNGGIGASTLTSHRNHDAARKAWQATSERGTHRRVPGMRRKTLVGIPWRLDPARGHRVEEAECPSRVRAGSAVALARVRVSFLALAALLLRPRRAAHATSAADAHHAREVVACSGFRDRQAKPRARVGCSRAEAAGEARA